jgi:hypothetical protein
MDRCPLEEAKRIAAGGLSFRIPAGQGLFPPRDVANAFFGCGYDDLPRDDVLEWEPFSLSAEDFDALLGWWRLTHPEARVDRLGVVGADFSRWFSQAVRQAG